MAAAAEEGTDRSRRRLRVRLDDVRHWTPGGLDDDPPATCQLLNAAAIDVGYQVPETIDAQDDAGDLSVLDARFGHVEQLPARKRPAQRAKVGPPGHPSGGVRQPISPPAR